MIQTITLLGGHGKSGEPERVQRIDLVENAGIHRTRALELLREHRKIFIFVTHDPRIALLSDYRIVMQGGTAGW